MKLTKVEKSYTRTDVEKDKLRMYIFTDNCDRTSGRIDIPDDSEYSQRFGKKRIKAPYQDFCYNKRIG